MQDMGFQASTNTHELLPCNVMLTGTAACCENQTMQSMPELNCYLSYLEQSDIFKHVFSKLPSGSQG